VIVAIDGWLITTRRAGERFAALAPGEDVRLTLRRGDRLIDQLLVAASADEADGVTLLRTAPVVSVGRGEAVFGEVPVRPGGADDLDVHFPRVESGAPVIAPRPPEITVELKRLQELSAALESLAEAPLPDSPGGHGGWYGVGLECSRCEIETQDDGVAMWTFSEPPRVTSVDPAGPAARAGVEAGDVLTHVDGRAIDREAGAKRFSLARPGETVEWTLRRGRDEVRVKVKVAGRRPRGRRL